MKARRVTVQWTDTAKEGLKKLPRKVRLGIFDKVDEFVENGAVGDHKPLKGPLEGYYRIVYSRYRAIYTLQEEEVGDGDVLVHVKIHFVAVGMRKEGDKKDVYRVAQKLVELGLINFEVPEEDEEDEKAG